MKQVNSAEFFTCKVDVPNSGERMDTRWNSLYVVEFRKDAIWEGYLACVTLTIHTEEESFPLSYRVDTVQCGTPSCVQDRSKAFSFFSSAGVGSLGRDLYVFASARRVLTFPSYVVHSVTTVAFPLSAGAVMMSSACFRLLMASCSTGERFVGGGLTLARHPIILVLASRQSVRMNRDEGPLPAVYNPLIHLSHAHTLLSIVLSHCM